MKHSDPTRHGGSDTPTSPSPPANPLDIISEDHAYARRICAVIDALAAAAWLDRQAAFSVLRFLNEEMNLHLRDEAEDLFPLLEERCTSEDSIESVLRRIRADQNEALRLLPEVRATLAGCLDADGDLTAGDRAMLTCFAGHVRRHLVAENAILLPIARARLSPSDLETLSEQMRSRREVPPVAKDEGC